MNLKRHHTDDGSTLVVVLVIMLVMTLAMTALAAIVTNTTSMTAEARDTVQSRAAADAGLAAVVAEAGRNAAHLCDADLSVATGSGDPVHYEADGTCDTAANTITFTATGWGPANSTSDVTAVYSYVTPQPVIPDPPAPSAGTGLLGAGGVTGTHNLRVAPIAGVESADLRVGAGGYSCSSARVYGDVYVDSGDVYLSNTCYIEGDLYARGNVSIANPDVSVGSVYTTGNFTQANPSRVRGNVIVGGNVTMTSGSSVAGTITAGGNVSLDNSSSGGPIAARGTVGLASRTTVDGTVHANGNVSVTGNSEVRGNVSTRGSATVHTATVTGAVTAAGTQGMAFYGVTIGSMHIGGHFTQFQASRVTGNVTAASTARSSVAPDTTITGTLTLGGELETWNNGPTTAQTRTRVAGLAPPTVDEVNAPEVPLAPDYAWVNYQITDAGWAGYTVKKLDTCNMQYGSWNPGATDDIDHALVPTIFDARHCAEVNLYEATLTLKNDVVIWVGRSFNGQHLRVNSATSEQRHFDIVYNAASGTGSERTCSDAGARITLSSMVMASNVRGVVYTPCIVQAQGGGSQAAIWNGDIYAGEIISGGSGLQVNYDPGQLWRLDGFPHPNDSGNEDGDGGGSGGGGTPTPGANDTYRLADLISREDSW